jgi:tetratricopeptide (TPR) repeat protein
MLARLSRAERIFTYAQKLFLDGKFEEAIRSFQAAYELSSAHIGMCLYWALALSEAGCRDEACEVMHRAITRQPSNPVLYMFLGQICFDHQDYPEALKHFQSALEIDPFNVHTQAYVALIALTEGNLQKFFDLLTRPIAFPAGSTEYTISQFGIFSLPSAIQLVNVTLQSRILLAIETYFSRHRLAPRSLSQQLVDLYRSHPPDFPSRCLASIDALLTHVILGAKRITVSLRYICNRKLRDDALRQIVADEAYYLSQTTRAIRCYQQLLEQRPQSLSIKQRLFELLYETGDFDKALTCLQELTHYGTAEHQPTPLDCLYLGELLYLVGKTEEGRCYLDQAAASPINEFKLYYFIGLDELKTGRQIHARRQFNHALRMLNPDICLLRLEELKRIYPLADSRKPQDRTPSPPLPLPTPK